jgi:hypothetical protein
MSTQAARTGAVIAGLIVVVALLFGGVAAGLISPRPSCPEPTQIVTRAFDGDIGCTDPGTIRPRDLGGRAWPTS